MSVKESKKIYVVIIKDKNNWEIAPTRAGENITLFTRFKKKEVEAYCKVRNALEGRKVFTYVSVEVRPVNQT